MNPTERPGTGFKIDGRYLVVRELLALNEQAQRVFLVSGYGSNASGTERLNTLRKTRGMQYLDSRPYQYGDDVSQMDWRVTARTGHAHIKQFGEETEKAVYFVVDQGADMHFGTRRAFKSVQAAHAAILAAWVASASQCRIGGMVLNDDVLSFSPLLAEKKGVEYLINTLIRQGSTDSCQQWGRTLKELVVLLQNVLPARSSLVLVSDFQFVSKDGYQHLKTLASLFDVTLVFIHDPLEQSIPDGEVVQLQHNGETAILDGRSNTYRQYWADQFRHRLQALERTCSGFEIDFVTLSTDQEPIELFSSERYRPV